MSDLYKFAERCVGEGRPAEAIAAYRRLADAGQDGAEPLKRMALLLREQGDTAASTAALERAAALAPDDPYPELRLAQAATALGRDLAAAGHLDRALDRASPGERPEMLVNLAAACLRLGWSDRAAAAVRPLDGPLTDWWASTRSMALAEYARARGEALAVLRARHGAVDPVHARWEIAWRLVHLGRMRVARRLCEQLMSELPGSFPPAEVFARILARAEGAEAAIAFLRAHPEHRADPAYPLALARLLHEAGHHAEAADLLVSEDVAAARDDVRLLVANTLFAAGRLDALRVWCRAWRAASPLNPIPAGFEVTLPWPGVDGPLADAARPAEPKQVRLVQFWDTAEVPADVAAVMETWRTHHPHAEHLVFDDARAAAFLRDRLGAEAVETFARCHHAAMKADFFRVAFLLAAGGVWVDADERCVRPMDAVLAAGPGLAATAVLCGDVPGYLHNYFLASRAGSPVMRIAVADAAAGVARASAEGRRPDIWQVTGPGLVTRAVAMFLADGGAAARRDVGLIGLQRWNRFAHTESDLAYKRDGAANWQLVDR